MWKVKLLSALTRRSTGWRLVDWFVGVPCFVFSTILLHFFKVFFFFWLLETILSKGWTDWRLWIGFLGRLEPRVSVLDCIFFLPRDTVGFFSIPVHLGFRLWVFLSLPASSSLFLSFSWLLGKSRLPLGHRASAQLSCLSQRRGLTSPYLALWRIISGTNKSLLSERSFRGEILISPNSSISGLRVFSIGWVGCPWWWFRSRFSRLWCEHLIQGLLMAMVARLFPPLDESRSV